jgi:hypothetical protein
MYYFGCWDRVGHYLHKPQGISVQNAGPFTSHIDGKYPPKTKDIRENEKESSITHEQGWTILAMWDRSVDERYGSNAAFLIEGTYTKEQMWQIAKIYYKQIVNRLKAAPLELESINDQNYNQPNVPSNPPHSVPNNPNTK